MKVLVTGTNGFVGKAIVQELLKEKYEVIELCGRQGAKDSLSEKSFQADISHMENLKVLENLENVDTIIHSAGLAHQFVKIPERLFEQVNAEGTRNIAELGAVLKIKHFILISSVAVYAKREENKNLALVDENSECRPEGAYAQSKLAGENAALEICRKNGISLTILRLATVIGEGDRGNTGRLIKAIDKKRFFWIGKGENLKSLVYLNDVAGACLAVLKKKKSGEEIFNVTATPVPMQEIVSVIAKTLDRKIPKLFFPVSWLRAIFLFNAKTFRVKKIKRISETLEKWISNDVFSGERLAEVYGFRAETSVEEGLRRQVLAYREQK